MKQSQMPLFEAQTSWFHVFKAMVDSGDVANMGPYAVTVYLVIKAYTNWKTGKSWPGIDLLVEKSGVSKAQVKRSLGVLCEKGYLVKEKVGRHNVYKLREKVPVFESIDGGRPVAEATWDYLPSTVKQAVAELRNFQVSGDAAGLQVVHIDHLVLNLQVNHPHANAAQNNVNAPLDWASVPDDDPVKRAWLASQKAKGQ